MSGAWAIDNNDYDNLTQPRPVFASGSSVHHNLNRLATESSSGPYQEDDMLPIYNENEHSEQCPTCGNTNQRQENEKEKEKKPVLEKDKQCDTWKIVMWILVGVIIVIILFAMAKYMSVEPESSSTKTKTPKIHSK
jgi:predicted nucleic acid-binding Zn ribbon protein